MIRFLAPSFNRKLSLISNTGTDIIPATTITTASAKNKKPFSTVIAKLFTKKGAERMGFLFTWNMMARSRDFKMKVYPSIGYLIVYIAIMFLNSKNLRLQQIQQQTAAGRIIIVTALYFSSLLLTMAVTQFIYSEKYKAAWLYFITPVAVPGNILNGAVKAAVIKFFVPAIFIIAIPGIALTGILFIPNLLLAVVNQLIICYLMIYLGNKELPFSKTQSVEVRTGNFLRNLFRMIIPLTIAFVHFFIYTSLPLVIMALVIAGIALWLIADSVSKFSWAAVKTTYSED